MGALMAFLAVLVLVFLWGRLWFHLVEGVSDRLRRRVSRREPPAWHPLPPEDETAPEDPEGAR